MKFPICIKCGKILKNPVSIRLGIGPICLSRQIGLHHPKRFSPMSSDIIPRLFDIEKKEKR